MRKKNMLLLLLLVLALTLLGGAGYYEIFKPSSDRLNLGLDLKGGVYVLLEAREASDDQDAEDALLRAITIIRNRIDEFGVAEPEIRREGKNRILIELPGIEDQARALEVIGRTAMLTFVGPEEDVVLTGADLVDAYVSFDELGRPAVSLEFNDEGTRKFAEATEKYLGKIISIYLDEELASAAQVRHVIKDGKAQITGNFTPEAARDLALVLRSGALPVELVELETRSVGPTLGKDSLDMGVKAGIFGLALVALFILVYYRFLGLVADFCLGLYIIMVLVSMSLLGATLTLPGIAGLILSIGMAVDANVIIFERIKEELRTGRSLRTALETGFQRAFRAVLDANVTTLIASGVLFYFGTGPVRGFAVTLSIGILVSFLTAIILTRTLLRLSARADLVKNLWYLGVKPGE
ncbi:MAG TPA: protein translocase subunit SecD [Firmicutes bacterium]|nr:protein translocase subunit SecD [Bacillota bacterium]